MAEDISLPLSHPPPHSKAWKLPIIMCSCASDEETPDFIINRVCLHPQCQQKALYCSECISKNLHDQLHSNHIFKLKDFLEGCVKACQGFKEQGPGSPKTFTVEALKLYDDKENLLSKYKEEIGKEINKVNSTFDKVLEEITAIFNERRGKLVAYLNKVYEMCELSFNMFSNKLDEYKQNLEFLKNNSIPVSQDELIKQFLPIKSSSEFQDCITKLKELKSRFDSVGEDSYFNLNLLSDTLQRYLEVCPSLKELPETKTKVYPLLESLELKQSIIGTQPKLTFENNDYFQEIFIEILQLLRPCCPEIPPDFKKVFAEFGPLINEAKKSPDFAVNVPNHYSPAVTAPYLHFFHFNTKDLYILRLPSNIQSVQSEGWCFEKVTLNIDFLLPSNHTSISTHDGRLYINGGKTALDKMYEMHFEEKRLIPRKSMKQRRWDHAICLSRGFIYVFGGADKEENYKLTKKCERYDSGLDMWTEISSFTTEASDFSVCSFKDKFIYKFGGWNSVSYVNIIERYDVQFDHWTVINSYLKPLLGGFPECIQINERQIYVFGGFYVKGHDENFLLEIEENDQEEWALNNGLEKIKFPNKQIFPVRSQFKMPKNALVHNKVVYTIYKNKEQSCLLAFDGNRWMILNDNIYLNNAIRSESFIE